MKDEIKQGINRITWDLRYASTYPIKTVTDKNESGTPVLPGKYFVEMFMSVDGVLSKIAGPQGFEAKVLNNSTLPVEDRAALAAFQKNSGNSIALLKVHLILYVICRQKLMFSSMP
ncbi:MAG: hypothetical protein M5T52_14935 [Ignavibacteriaceae bacterium]|nr:hypothetical protein [Ignavibacteriaceae bacterium]